LTYEQQKHISELLSEIERVPFPKEPYSPFVIFENKNFNLYKSKYPHLKHAEITDLLSQLWKFKLTGSDRDIFQEMST
jgi:hypothetical protein